MSTHAYTEEKISTAAHMFRFWLGMFTAVIRDNKFVKVEVRIPKEGNCEGCPLYAWFSLRDFRCRYLNVVIHDAKKDKDCPAKC